MATISSVTGPIDTANLGMTYMHEHMMIGTPGFYHSYPHLWKHDEFLNKAIHDVKAAYDRGIRTIVDLTPSDFHRDVRFVREIAQKTGMQIIVATGIYWKSTWYFEGHPIEDLATLLTHDILFGIQNTDIKAGILKVATDEPGVTEVNERALRAVARAHRRTGVPISTHTNAHKKVGLQQQEIFKSEGVDLGRVIIGHSGDSTDLGYLEALIQAGSYIGMDRFGLYIEGLPGFEERVDTIVKLCERGYADRMVLSHDAGCIFDWLPSEFLYPLSKWNFTHIMDDVVPELQRRGVRKEQIDQMLIHNPRTIFEQQGAY